MANPVLKRIRIVLWGAVGLVVIGLGVVSLWPRADGPVATAAAEPYGQGDYEVVTTQGEEADDSLFVGQPSAVFFGFTHCPDVCPTTLGEMSLWFSELGAEAEDLRGFFATVDPERDTAELLGQYVGWASDRITGITGTPEDMAAMAEAWGVYAERVPLEGGGYTMDHTASVFLLDEDGLFQGTIAYGEATETALEKLRMLVAG